MPIRLTATHRHSLIQHGPRLALAASLLSACLAAEIPPAPAHVAWFGVHAPIHQKAHADVLLKEIPGLAKFGINLIIVEINYNFEYASHPELRSASPVSLAAVKKLVATCRSHGIRLIPQFQCLGHQSWEQATGALLTRYPQFDETPGQYPGNRGIYCRSWCPLHPEVNRIVFALFDELLDAFEADALHVGMDEVFLIASEHCPRCRGKHPAEVFAKAVNDYHGHIVKKRGKEMLMWGDRLLDAGRFDYGKWEAAENGTHAAADLIPKDIIICDWHYNARPAYPSVPFFLEKGFRVLPASYDDAKAVSNLIAFSLEAMSERMLGHLCTLWTGPHAGFAAVTPQLTAASRRLITPKVGKK